MIMAHVSVIIRVLKKITGDPKWVHSAPGIMEPPVSISNHEVRNKKYDLTGPITTH